MEPWHGLKSLCMDEGLNGLGENESVSPMKISLGSASQSNDSACRLGFSQPLDTYEPDE